MSTAAMQAAGQYAHIPTTSTSYAASSSPHQYVQSQAQDDEGYYLNQNLSTDSTSQSSRKQKRSNVQPGTSTASSQRHYFPTNDGDEYEPTSTRGQSAYSQATTTLPIHSRDQSMGADQYDGAPVPPPRISSHQQGSPRVPIAPSTAPLEARVAASRQAREGEAQKYAGPVPPRGGNYDEPTRERSRDDTAMAAASAARTRRKGPASPDGPHRAASTRERGQESALPAQSRSEAAMLNAAPAPLVREHSEVLNRVVVSDPIEDEERMQERVAEAQPAALGSEATSTSGLGLVGSEGVDDGGRGPQRRQDYSKTSGRRKDVQFGDYMLGQTLGEGEFGKVKLGWKKDGSSQVAIKLIRRETVATNPSRLPKIYREISILRDLAHPNIVRLHEMVETERHIGIILEYASGGELFDYILNHRYLKDPAARRLFAQLVSGVGYLHKKGIVHRDLKLENLLLDQNRNIIITDFGFANTFNPGDELSDEIEYNLGNRDFVRKFKLDRLDANGMRKGDLMQTSCGSPCYAAPELVVSDSLYTGRKVDVWSCGVILYAMLAGYLPFDDDPANPEGDNINLLYKYITNTPLTFPEYVSPHARDLLRRILVPDPRKRADLFEVARHSWLSEYHHVVSHITSSTTNIADIANSTVPSESIRESAIPSRSASVRAPPKPASGTAPGAALSPTAEVSDARDYEQAVPPKREKSSRHTLQPEYVPPQTHTVRGAAPDSGRRVEPVATAAPASFSKPLPADPPPGSPPFVSYGPASSQQKMAGPMRPGRDVPRATTDSSGGMGMPAASQQTTRPSTQGSLNSASGPTNTKSDLRLPSRGSYGQPVAPTVATTNVQGRVTQPARGSRGYNISGPVPQHGAHNSIGQPMTQPMSPPAASPPPKGHHRRSSTFSNLSERLFGRTSSVMKKDKEEARQKNGRRYPPTAMKDSYATEAPTRTSTDSKRSFSFGLGKKRSTDLESQHEEKAGRRFSLIPNSMSFRTLMGGSRDHLSDAGSPPPAEYAPAPSSRPPTGQYYGSHDGQQDAGRPPKVNNFSRPPQAQYRHQSQPSSNDVYGGTGVYHQPYESRAPHQRQDSRPAAQFQPRYPDGFDEPARPSMQQGQPNRGVLTKNNRRFTDAYENEQGPAHHGGSSGAVKKVQDFFRRRGRARADSEYR